MSVARFRRHEGGRSSAHPGARARAHARARRVLRRRSSWAMGARQGRAGALNEPSVIGTPYEEIGTPERRARSDSGQRDRARLGVLAEVGLLLSSSDDYVI